MRNYFSSGESSFLNRQAEVFAKRKNGYVFPASIFIKVLPTLEESIQLVSTIGPSSDASSKYDRILFDLFDGKLLGMTEGCHQRFALKASWCFGEGSVHAVPLNLMQLFPKLQSLAELAQVDRWERAQKLDSDKIYDALMEPRPQEEEVSAGFSKVRLHEVKVTCRADDVGEKKGLQIGVITFVDEDDGMSRKSRTEPDSDYQLASQMRAKLNSSKTSRKATSEKGSKASDTTVLQMEETEKIVESQERIRRMKEVRDQFNRRRWKKDGGALLLGFLAILGSLSVLTWGLVFVETDASRYMAEGVRSLVVLSKRNNQLPRIAYLVKQVDLFNKYSRVSSNVLQESQLFAKNRAVDTLAASLAALKEAETDCDLSYLNLKRDWPSLAKSSDLYLVKLLNDQVVRSSIYMPDALFQVIVLCEGSLDSARVPRDQHCCPAVLHRRELRSHVRASLRGRDRPVRCRLRVAGAGRKNAHAVPLDGSEHHAGREQSVPARDVLANPEQNAAADLRAAGHAQGGGQGRAQAHEVLQRRTGREHRRLHAGRRRLRRDAPV